MSFSDHSRELDSGAPTVHLDLGHADELAACGYYLGDNGGEDWTTDPAKVTCAGCSGELVSKTGAEAVTT